MIILFVNAHKNNEQGTTKFDTYYNNIKSLIYSSVSYGKDFVELVRRKDDLEDLIYDETTFKCDKKTQQKFKSVEYVFIDGAVTIPPWSPCMKQLFLLIRLCCKQHKKFHFNGHAFFSLYFYLSTGLDKDYTILTEKTAKKSQVKPDYQFCEQTGDLLFHDKIVCNSGLKCVKSASRPFNSKSVYALNKGIILPTKFHFLVFDSKNGNKILHNINFPFPFFCKDRVFCTSKTISKSKANILIEMENQTPIAYTYGQGLATHSLCPQILQIIMNWLCFSKDGFPFDSANTTKNFNSFKDLVIDNKVTIKKSLGRFSQSVTLTSVNSRAKQNSSKFSRVTFQKPSVRCSGPYFTEKQRYLSQGKVSKTTFLGRTRMNFSGTLQKNEIKNYVTMTPSRPPSAHNFRQTDKNKWLSKNNFFVC